VLGTSGKLHDRHRLGDQVGGPRPEDVDAQHAVGLGVGEDLDHPFGLVHRPGPRVGAELEPADAVFAPGSLYLLFGGADAGHFRPGVDDAGDGVVVDVRFHAGHALDAGDTVVLGLVGQHRPGDQVADREDARDVGLVVVVDADPAGAFLQFDARLLQP